MIDIENIVINTVNNDLATIKSKYPKLQLLSEPVEALSVLPTVTLWEVDNATYEQSLDESLTEHHATVTYEANVYVANENGRKRIAKEIADVVDMSMQNMKFRRMTRTPTPNLDRSIYRISMRYQAIVQEGREDGDDIIYQMYRT